MEVLQGFQFWIKLPAKNKAEKAVYAPLQADEFPEIQVDKDGGKIRVFIGCYDEQKASIPVYSKQFLYHIILNQGGAFYIDTEKDTEYAALFIDGEGKVNDADATEAELYVFRGEGSGIELENKGESTMEVILFGGALSGLPGLPLRLIWDNKL